VSKTPWRDDLEAARKAAVARAKEAAEATPPPSDVSDLSIEDCFVRVLIEMFALGVGLGLGVMPDGMAIWIRLRMPAEAKDPRAGHVAFVAHNDPQTVWQKAVLALESSSPGQWWKPDRFASSAR
jgi:hypothetical protein